MMRELNCVNCIHWNFDAGEADYSDLTPGSDWSSSCGKSVWYMYGHDVTEAEFRKNMRTAENCALYEDNPA